MSNHNSISKIQINNTSNNSLLNMKHIKRPSLILDDKSIMDQHNNSLY
jgi:hypothetical protein